VTEIQSEMGQATNHQEDLTEPDNPQPNLPPSSNVHESEATADVGVDMSETEIQMEPEIDPEQASIMALKAMVNMRVQLTNLKAASLNDKFGRVTGFDDGPGIPVADRRLHVMLEGGDHTIRVKYSNVVEVIESDEVHQSEATADVGVHMSETEIQMEPEIDPEQASIMALKAMVNMRVQLTNLKAASLNDKFGRVTGFDDGPGIPVADRRLHVMLEGGDRTIRVKYSNVVEVIESDELAD
jgi:hypothetical protein